MTIQEVTQTPSEATEETFSLDQVCGCFKHRAEWLYFLSRNGLAEETEDGPLHQAIRACGHYHAHTKFKDTQDLQELADIFRGAPARYVFDMHTNQLDDEVFEVEFHQCPLVEAWNALGVDPADQRTLCDIAMDGDRGIIEQLGAFTFELPETIANGDSRCLIRILKK